MLQHHLAVALVVSSPPSGRLLPDVDVFYDFQKRRLLENRRFISLKASRFLRSLTPE
jgi:hypothetical protein